MGGENMMFSQSGPNTPHNSAQMFSEPCSPAGGLLVPPGCTRFAEPQPPMMMVGSNYPCDRFVPTFPRPEDEAMMHAEYPQAYYQPDMSGQSPSHMMMSQNGILVQGMSDVTMDVSMDGQMVQELPMQGMPLHDVSMQMMNGCFPTSPTNSGSSPCGMGSPHAMMNAQQQFSGFYQQDYQVEEKMMHSVYSTQTSDRGRSEENTATSTESGATSQVGDFSDISRRPSMESYERLLQDLNQNNVQYAAEQIARSNPNLGELTSAVQTKALSDPGQATVLADLVYQLSNMELVPDTARVCAEFISSICDTTPRDRVMCISLFTAELYKRGLLQMSVLKELFQQLVFIRTSSVPEHFLRATCEVLHIVGPRLDRSEVGGKMTEFILLRFKELRNGKYSAPLRQSLFDVEQLRANGWQAMSRRSTKDTDMSSVTNRHPQSKGKLGKGPKRFPSEAGTGKGGWVGGKGTARVR
jgi:hypothetical protein